MGLESIGSPRPPPDSLCRQKDFGDFPCRWFLSRTVALIPVSLSLLLPIHWITNVYWVFNMCQTWSWQPWDSLFLPTLSVGGSPVGLHAGILGGCQHVSPLYCSLLPYCEVWIIKSGSGRAGTAGGGGGEPPRREEESFLCPAYLHCPHFFLVAGSFRVLFCSAFLRFAFLRTISNCLIHLREPLSRLLLSWMPEWSKEAPGLRACSHWAATTAGRTCAQGAWRSAPGLVRIC